ncbi:MAG: CBS domain-containing protein [Deltaproteobacteria bacterium]|nr:CBS domain-containing protein [Deltaproteobacteria bacterium]
MSHLKSLIKNPKVVTLPPTASIYEASQKMAEHLIGSVIVMEGDRALGIFTERDLLNRVVSKGLDPRTTLLSQVMSQGLKTVSIQETVEACFRKMEESKCRHIPVEDDGKLVGVVTMRNILEWLTDQIKEENLFLKNYIQS